MKNLVISLTSNTERRQHISTEFQGHNVNFEFFDALTPDIAIPYAQTLGLNLDKSQLAPTELACMMSHVAVWKKAIDESMPYITIFEDDIYLGIDAELLLNNYEWIQPNWNIIKIESFYKKVYLSSKTYSILSKKRYIAELKSKNLGTAGYILSLEGAKILLEFVLHNNIHPIDQTIFNFFVHDHKEPVFQMVPALCAQEMIIKESQEPLSLPSLLEEERKIRLAREPIDRKKHQTALFKINREISRVFLKARKTLLTTKVDFK
ncbi:glycosyl transferase [Psychrobacter sp. 4Dc]|uniref:glycosyltransferase family 25 protein n=1 Tax=Psychrobacter sp. 4Dc TaxID=888437 RepID=UPI000CAB540D|nr:glycosyltransferase family 25 protein [Psychrobacter sp. 4Dc]PKH63990.1 glycosyl transferase [Psychrobacter sp. 4Dc]